MIGRKLGLGTYVDLAANDHMSLSNSWYLDRCAGWRGLCVEANPRYFASLYLERTCSLVPLCLGNKEHRTQFLDAGVLGGVLETNKNLVQNYSYQVQAKKATSFSVFCTTLKRVLAKEVWLQHIDVFSLDVEGHELAVLEGFPWDNVTIGLIILEPNDPKAEAFLAARGFVGIPIRHSDTWFVNPRYHAVEELAVAAPQLMTDITARKNSEKRSAPK